MVHLIDLESCEWRCTCRVAGPDVAHSGDHFTWLCQWLKVISCDRYRFIALVKCLVSRGNHRWLRVTNLAFLNLQRILYDFLSCMSN